MTQGAWVPWQACTRAFYDNNKPPPQQHQGLQERRHSHCRLGINITQPPSAASVRQTRTAEVGPFRSCPVDHSYRDRSQRVTRSKARLSFPQLTLFSTLYFGHSCSRILTNHSSFFSFLFFFPSKGNLRYFVCFRCYAWNSIRRSCMHLYWYASGLRLFICILFAFVVMLGIRKDEAVCICAGLRLFIRMRS